MMYFVLYLLSVAFVISVAGIFVFLVGRLVLRDSGELMRLSLESVVGGLDRVGGGQTETEHAVPRRLQVQVAGPRAGLAVGQLLPLQTPISTLGRSQRNYLVLADPQISGEHLSLALELGEWWVTDLNSRNGTWLYPLDGPAKQLTRKPERLSQGDVLALGSLRLRLVP